MSFEVTKDTIIGDILGMHCLGCPASRGESIADACMVHGVNPDELIEKLNKHFANK